MLDELDTVFDDHPSLDASLEDFEANSHAHRPTVYGLPSQHSGFRSEESDGEDEDATPNGERWSPPGFRRYDYVQGSGWYRRQPYSRKVDPDRSSLKPTLALSPSQSREPSPQFEDAVELPAPGKRVDSEPKETSVAANVPLPTDADVSQRSPSPGPRAPTAAIPEKEGTEFAPESNNLSNCRLHYPSSSSSSLFPSPCSTTGETGTGMLIWAGRLLLKISALLCAQKSNTGNPWPHSAPIFGPSSTASPVPSPALPCLFSWSSSPWPSCAPCSCPVCPRQFQIW